MMSTCVLLQAGFQFCCPDVWNSCSRYLVLLFPVPGTPVPDIRYSCSQLSIRHFPFLSIFRTESVSLQFSYAWTSGAASYPHITPYYIGGTVCSQISVYIGGTVCSQISVRGGTFPRNQKCLVLNPRWVRICRLLSLLSCNGVLQVACKVAFVWSVKNDRNWKQK